jgi:hypothetical protein
MAEPSDNSRHAVRKQHPPYWLRLTAMFVDLVVCATLSIPLTPILQQSMALYAGFMIFFWVTCEMFWGRTPAKMLLGMQMVDARLQKPTRGRILWRNALRLFWPVAVLSWRRVTLLDALSGCRVLGKPSPVKSKPSQPKGWR